MVDSIANIFDTVFIIVDKRSDTEVIAMLLTAAPNLQLPEMDGYKVYRPGMYKAKWTLKQAKKIIALLKSLDYTVIIYKLEAITSWFGRFESLPNTDSIPQIDDLRTIAKQLPPAHTYVELFGGGIPFIFLRDPAPVEVYNDVSSHVVNFMRTLRYPEQFGWLFLLSRLFPIDQKLSPIPLRNFVRGGEEGDDVVRAYAWYYQARQTFAQVSDDLIRNSVLLESVNDDMDLVVDALEEVDSLLPAVHGRIFRAQIEQYSWQKIIEIYDSTETLFWVDPPHKGTGFLQMDERPEYSTFDHLLNKLHEIKGRVALYCSHEDGHPAFAARDTGLSLPNAAFEKVELPTCTVWLSNP